MRHRVLAPVCVGLFIFAGCGGSGSENAEQTKPPPHTAPGQAEFARDFRGFEGHVRRQLAAAQAVDLPRSLNVHRELLLDALRGQIGDLEAIVDSSGAGNPSAMAAEQETLEFEQALAGSQARALVRALGGGPGVPEILKVLAVSGT